ncbi:hypothetical protein BB559_001069 [Furculomyces boomerangus]|uniref:N-acetyltransferase ECO1 n=1 Tax=Furculomyces boomerangus TaxID=61424 RepID=A0A2T9Z335_9FUNG|nr:hypothetical protein BB559_001069 [Furculomyces boomerangus]
MLTSSNKKATKTYGKAKRNENLILPNDREQDSKITQLNEHKRDKIIDSEQNLLENNVSNERLFHTNSIDDDSKKNFFKLFNYKTENQEPLLDFQSIDIIKQKKVLGTNSIFNNQLGSKRVRSSDFSINLFNRNEKKSKENNTKQTQLKFSIKSQILHTCIECKMKFQKGNLEDEAIHKKFHKNWISSNKNIIRWPTYSSTINTKDEPAKNIIEIKDIPLQSYDKLILVKSGCKENLLKKALCVLNLVNTELNAVKHTLSDLKVSERATRHVVGCVLTEKIDTDANIYIKSKEHMEKADFDSETKNNSFNNMSITESSIINKKPICGISRIWVAKTERRQGIGRLLINAVRKHFIYGTVLEPENIAFSQTTSKGNILALSTSKFGWYYIYQEQ